MVWLYVFLLSSPLRVHPTFFNPWWRRQITHNNFNTRQCGRTVYQKHQEYDNTQSRQIRCNKADWTNITSAMNKYNSTKHSSTEMRPKEAHKDTNHLKVGVNQTLNAKNRRYPPISVDDTVKYTNGNEATTATGKRPTQKGLKDSTRFLRIKKRIRRATELLN